MSGLLGRVGPKIRDALPPEIYGFYVRHIDRRALRMRDQPVRDENVYSLKPCLEKQAIFVHIPKCAGLSITKALFGCRAGGHSKVGKYKALLTPQEFERFFKFTFVRNPWDRLVSAYYFLDKGGIGGRDMAVAAHLRAEYADFRDFVRKGVAVGAYERILHFQSQHRFLCLRKTSAPLVDFIGRFETIDDDFRTICERLNVETTLPKTNTGSRPTRSYRDAYDDETRTIVARRYARDIALFGYDF
jgi:hypothetical protein